MVRVISFDHFHPQLQTLTPTPTPITQGCLCPSSVKKTNYQQECHF